jgi:hypothetical protein
LLQRLDRASRPGSVTLPPDYSAERPGKIGEPALMTVQGVDPHRFAIADMG